MDVNKYYNFENYLHQMNLIHFLIMRTPRLLMFSSILLFASFLNPVQSQVVRDTVHVQTAGTLSTLIPSSDKLTIENLKVTGLINGTDLYFLRQSILGNGSGKLTSIDLIESKITTGGSSIYTSENQLPSYAFDGCAQLKHIALPDQITSIGGYAFHGCLGLSTLNIPDSVTSIGDYALTNCSTLVSVKFPKKLKTIGSYAFSNCIVLDTVNLPEGVISLGYRSFWTCLSVKSVTLPQTIRSIGDGSFFMWRQIQSIVIPDSVTTLGDYMFTSSYKLESVHLPAKLTSLGTEAFYACVALKSINWPSGLKSIGEHGFSRCFSLTNVALPEGLTSIGAGVFETDFKLTSVELPNSLTNLSTDAFRECFVLSSVKLPTGLTSIAPYAFKSCHMLKSVELPVGLKTIGSYAFGTCKAMKEIHLPATVTSISGYAFDSTALESIVCKGVLPPTLSANSFVSSIYNTCRVFVPSGTAPTYKTANYWKNFMLIGYVPIPTVFLSINLADNGFLKQKVLKDSSFTCYLVAKDGWKINTVLLNDSDVTSLVDTSGMLSIPALGMDVVLNVSFEKRLTDVGRVTNEPVKVFSEGRSIVVSGAELGSKIFVFDLSGRLMQTVRVSSDMERIPVDGSQVYVIRTTEKLFKLAI